MIADLLRGDCFVIAGHRDQPLRHECGKYFRGITLNHRQLSLLPLVGPHFVCLTSSVISPARLTEGILCHISSLISPDFQ